MTCTIYLSNCQLCTHDFKVVVVAVVEGLTGPWEALLGGCYQNRWF